jgi:antitoxin ParD1/3/4
VPTRNIVLTHEQDEFVESIVRAGEYRNANEAIGDALRTLQQRRREDALRLDALRTLMRAGANALEGGDFTEVEDCDLDRFIEVLGSRQGGRES